RCARQRLVRGQGGRGVDLPAVERHLHAGRPRPDGRLAAHRRGEIGTQGRSTPMTATTPFLTNEDMLGPLASRYVDVESLPWKPTPCPGIDMKILLEDKESGLLTALFRWQAGAELALHEHVEVEQTFVLQGSLVDEEGETTAGNYDWRPKCNTCIAI